MLEVGVFDNTLEKNRLEFGWCYSDSDTDDGFYWTWFIEKDNGEAFVKRCRTRRGAIQSLNAYLKRNFDNEDAVWIVGHLTLSDLTK